ncbi:MAG TPA: cupredoxin domain-containing protein [Nitrososphaerales archaeon]|nr:cupredoxin domain-containing protein [Nitrososphaerales archaeon]HUK75178.1 cupredoxin domain-containing protein [Nitrososphaerales archaeon]
MSQPKGSLTVALAITVIVVIAVSAVGYYQFVYCTSNSCTNKTTTTAAAGCAPPSCVTIDINFGAATLTTTAYTPDVAKLVIGVNNTFQFLNNDSQGGGIFHSATMKTCPQTCPFDTGVIAYNVTKGPFTITTPGTYPYYCVVHPTTMVGTIVVVAGSGSSGGASSSKSSSSTTTTTSSSSTAPPANALPIIMPKGAGGNSTSTAAISGFSPGNVTVVIGVNNTLTWTNDDVSAHTVTSTAVPNGAATFNSGIISSGQTYTMTFTVPGVYKYDCSLHLWMKGEVIVKSG